MSGFYTDDQGRVRPINGKKGVGGGGAVAAAVLAGVVALGGSGGGAAVAADTAVGASFHAAKASSKVAARKGHHTKAWQQVGLKNIKRTEVKSALQCVVHSHGQVREFFVHMPCRSLDRQLLLLGDGDGNTLVVSIAWVQMPTAGSAFRLKQLIDVYGTGDIYPLGGELLQIAEIEFTAQYYDSRQRWSLLVIAETEPASGSPDPELLDAVAEIAVHFPPP